MIEYNMNTLESANLENNLDFEDFLELTLHELTHVFGFSGSFIENYWIDKSTGSTYTNPTTTMSVRGLTTNILKTPKV